MFNELSIIVQVLYYWESRHDVDFVVTAAPFTNMV